MHGGRGSSKMSGVSIMWWVIWLGLLALSEGQRPFCRPCHNDTSVQPAMTKEFNRRCLEGGLGSGCGRVPCCLGGIGSRCGRGLRCERGMTCRFPKRGAHDGICKVPTGKACIVGSRVHHHGEQFSTDCRTQCTCQNGTYACASRCPRENIAPRGACFTPRLVEIPGQCCREWLCDGPPVTEPPHCVERSTPWTKCSATCGGGLSKRTSNANSSCRQRNDTRLCQRSSCKESPFEKQYHQSKHHHVRRGHSCKATQRLSTSYLKVGSCVSQRQFHPRICGGCLSSDICCKPTRTTTINVKMVCHGLRIDEESDDIYEIFDEMIFPGKDIWVKTKNSTKHLRKKHNKIEKHRFGSANMWKDQMIDIANDKEGTTTLEKTHLRNYRKFLRYVERNIHIIKMEWILRCECSKNICSDMKESKNDINLENGAPDIPSSTVGQVLLHRVHRTLFTTP